MSDVEILADALAGRYRIEREIGRGGMATVFVAHDEKHRRSVALKVLDPELGAVLGAERFLSEIRVTAALQHPNLLPLFDSGEARGLLYYVMPYVEGESLRHRLDREKQLPIDEALHIATGVANALDYAHSHGVIHRDLKPENILLQHGQPVIADFGIALAVSNAGGARVTQTGLSLGTPQYMSPEQATGDRAIDGRTDIYSLAAVLYEMLAGEPPHTGGTAQAIIAKLMTTEPQPVRTLRPAVPPNVAMAVERGLAKLPADRFATAKAFADALANPSFATQSALVASAAAPRTTRATWMLGALSVALAGVALWGWLRPAEKQPVLRYALAIDSSEAVITAGRWGRIALSPDGSTLAYIGGPNASVMVRHRDQLTATALPGTQQSGAPFFSPDGKRIGFIQGARRLKIASLDGSPPILVTDSLIGLGGLSWAPDDIIYADGTGPSPLTRVAARAGAKPERLPVPDTSARTTDHFFPQVLPDGSVLVATQRKSARADAYGIAVLDPKSGVAKPVLENAVRARYVETGHLLWLTTDGNLMVSGFKLSRREVIGSPQLVAEGLNAERPNIDFTVSRAGTLAYIAGLSRSDDREAVWVGRDGKVQYVDSTWRTPLGDPAISPDGTRLAISTASRSIETTPKSDILIKRLDATPPSKLTLEDGANRFPVWTRDGKKLVYVRTIGDTSFVLERDVDGGAPPVARFSVQDAIGLTLTPGGDQVVYAAGFGIFSRVYVRGAGDSVGTRVIQGSSMQRTPALSPDGKWLAYVLFEAGAQRLFVSPFPNPSDAKLLVSDRAVDPTWSNRGTELFFRDVASQSLVVVPVTTSPVLSIGAPKTLFNAGPYSPGFAVARDDSRFLMLRGAGGASAERLIVVENWARNLAAVKR